MKVHVKEVTQCLGPDMNRQKSLLHSGMKEAALFSSLRQVNPSNSTTDPTCPWSPPSFQRCRRILCGVTGGCAAPYLASTSRLLKRSRLLMCYNALVPCYNARRYA